jgi:hypothetical protein
MKLRDDWLPVSKRDALALPLLEGTILVSEEILLLWRRIGREVEVGEVVVKNNFTVNKNFRSFENSTRKPLFNTW